MSLILRILLRFLLAFKPKLIHYFYGKIAFILLKKFDFSCLKRFSFVFKISIGKLTVPKPVLY
jgi:hypothetical protein